MRKVYFGNLGQFGDILMQEPALRQFIKDNPQDKITLGASVKFMGALKIFENYHPNITALKVWNSYGEFPTPDDLHYIKNEKFDFFTIKPQGGQIVAEDNGMILQHAEPDWAVRRHIVEESGLMQGITVTDKQLTFKNNFNIKKLPKTIGITLFPSDWRLNGVKSLNEFSVANIVKICNKLGYNVIHINGPGEPDVPGAPKVNGTYIESIKAILSTDMLVTCDTGMMWAASGYQHPVVGLFGWASNPVAGTSVNWQPLNPNATYLEAPRANDIKPRDIIQAIVEKIRTL